jgi:hypothetical protein
MWASTRVTKKECFGPPSRSPEGDSWATETLAVGPLLLPFPFPLPPEEVTGLVRVVSHEGGGEDLRSLVLRSALEAGAAALDGVAVSTGRRVACAGAGRSSWPCGRRGAGGSPIAT